jgi:signal transduction histidine kinase
MRYFVNDFNLKKQAKELGVKVWQTPGFLFIMMGLIAIVVMTATYFMSQKYDDPQILVIAECIVTSIILIVGNSVIRVVDQVVRLNKMKSEFISVASHQLRTPISAIKWETELLLTKFKKGLNQKQLKNIETISGLSNRMIRLISDLLDVARIDQGRLMLKKESVNIQKIVSDVVSELSSFAKARNINVVYEENKKIPATCGDSSRIKMVVENLIDNSIKYSANRGRIEIKLIKKSGSIQFSIKDNGVGIPEEQQSRVFEKFFRSNNSVRYQTEGTGLGLYIAKSIVEQSGGKMWFNSVEGLGTIFIFTLPLKYVG